MSQEDCFVCMEALSVEDVEYPLKCPSKCGYNMCSECIEQWIKSSKSELQEASDGHLAVRVRLQCPQCRGDLSTTIQDTLLCRQETHKRQTMIPQNDSDLSAQELRTKYSTELQEARERLSNNNATNHKMLFVDRPLLAGLHYVMSGEEQTYISQLMSSGDVAKLAQAAQILSGISDLSRQGLLQPVDNPELFELDEHQAIIMKAITQYRKQYPLPKRMPIHIQLEPPADSAGFKFKDDSWDGSVANAFVQASNQNKNRVLIKRVPRGKAANQGIQKGDVVTHINGEPFTGNAQDLTLLFQTFHNQSTPFTLIVNAEQSTAQLLYVRGSLPFDL